MPPRNFYGLPPSWNPGFEIPDYVMAEPPGMGTFTTAWLPRGTISQMIPDFAAVDVGKEILGRANAGLGSLGDDTLGVSKSTRARDPIGNYGKVAASWLMRSIKSVPADQRVAALRAIFDAVDPSLWAAVDARAKTLRAAGGSAARALEDAIAISLSAGMLREVVEQGKRARRGQRPATSGHLALGSDRRAVPRAQVYALEALGFSLSDLNPIPHIVDAARATGRGIKTAATATAGFVKNGIKTLGSLACDVVSSGAGAAAATLAAGPAGAAGASAASGICSPKATLAVPPALPMYQPPAPKKSWLVPAVMVAGAVGVGAVIISRKR